MTPRPSRPPRQQPINIINVPPNTVVYLNANNGPNNRGSVVTAPARRIKRRRSPRKPVRTAGKSIPPTRSTATSRLRRAPARPRRAAPTGNRKRLTTFGSRRSRKPRATPRMRGYLGM